ncbi:MAG: hypothetical protein EOP06_21825 [Proteobacteria bacterium]|nr:MAG: hypothetical protein EOP06_21825 [Pseudomonadota bacterium]
MDISPKSYGSDEDLFFFGQRFVALACRIFGPEIVDPMGSYFAASGFVLSIYGHWFLITAGHVLADIEDAKNRGYTFTNWQLDDTFALKRKRPVYVDGPGAPETIPFDFEGQPKISYFNRDEGTDFAFIYLGSYYERCLKANDVIAFEEEHWTLDIEGASHRMELVGIPADQTRDLKRGGLVQKTLVTLKLHRIEDDSLLDNRYPHLLQGHIPEIPTDVLPTLERIHGMSGGPIIGFWEQPDGSEKIRILAIQSQWNKHTQTIIGSPIGQAASGLKQMIDEWVAGNEEGESSSER